MWNKNPIKIFDSEHNDEPAPSGFNAIKISLDGSLKSALDWSAAKESARRHLDNGLNIFWDLDLGLVKGLPHPLGNSSQFLSLKIALEHFCEQLWSPFHEHTAGVSLYRGRIDFHKKFVWDEEQQRLFEAWKTENHYTEYEPTLQETLYCRRAVCEYTELLAGHLPETLQPYLFLDVSSLNDSLFKTIILNREHCPNLQFGVRNEGTLTPPFAWHQGVSYSGYLGRDLSEWQHKPLPACGICIPTLYRPIQQQRLKSALDQLHIPYRIISEDLLTQEWDGLDYLIVLPEILSHLGIRKLHGFCAAGGTIVNLGRPLSLPYEITLEGLLKMQPTGIFKDN